MSDLTESGHSAWQGAMAGIRQKRSITLSVAIISVIDQSR
jgi:hypothetical protein